MRITFSYRGSTHVQPEIQIKTPLSKHPKQPFHAIVPKAPRDGALTSSFPLGANSPLAISLLECLLQFEPTRRYDAHQAMVHPYFSAGPIPPPGIPSAPSSSTASLALPPRVAARASQASAVVQAQNAQMAAEQQARSAVQVQAQQNAQAMMAAQQQYMMQAQQQGHYGEQQQGHYGEQYYGEHLQRQRFGRKLSLRSGPNAGSGGRTNADGPSAPAAECELIRRAVLRP